MKRSQMRAKICLSMIKTYQELKGEPFPFNIGQISKFADDILVTLEEAGMLPPRRMISDEKWVDDLEYGGKVKQGKMWHRSWEPEDETP